jgi:hypothetical protein
MKSCKAVSEMLGGCRQVNAPLLREVQAAEEGLEVSTSGAAGKRKRRQKAHAVGQGDTERSEAKNPAQLGGFFFYTRLA